jgi:hypothetical protein
MVAKYNVRRHFTALEREKIFQRDNYICAYCGDLAEVIDHVVPWSWSHCSDEDNLVASCVKCNALVGNMMFRDFTEKYKYINRKRGRQPKIIFVPYPNPRQLNAKCSCGKLFRAGDDQATRVICGDCVREEDVRIAKWEKEEAEQAARDEIEKAAQAARDLWRREYQKKINKRAANLHRAAVAKDKAEHKRRQDKILQSKLDSLFSQEGLKEKFLAAVYLIIRQAKK